MISRRLLTFGLPALLASAAGVEPVRAEPYPAKPVMLITPSGAGAGADVIARIVGERLTQLWGRQVLVANRPGGGGVIAAQAAAAATKDGYTLYLPLASTFVFLPLLQAKLPIDFQSDLVPVGLLGEQPMVLAVHPSLGVNTLEKLIALARAKPSHVLYGAGRGTMPHLTGALFAARAGIDLTFVAYPSAARALSDAIAGTLTMFIESIAGMRGPLEAGQLKALAVASAQRLPDYPDLPTVAEAAPSLAPFEARGWFALMALAGTSDEIVQKISRDLRSLLLEPAIREKLAALGTYPRPLSPHETARFIEAEQEAWKPIVQHIGVTAQ